MEEGFKIEASKKHFQKHRGIMRALKMLLVIMSIFILFMLLDNDTSMDVVFYSVLTFVICGGIGLFIRSQVEYPLDNTIIIITNNEIIRKGENLLTIRMKFDEIDKVKYKSTGIVLMNNNISSKMNYHLSNFALTSEFGILFIPSNIENFDKVKSHILEKIR